MLAVYLLCLHACYGGDLKAVISTIGDISMSYFKVGIITYNTGSV